MKTQPDLGIENPYALDEDQLAAAVDLLKQQSESVGEYWADYTKEITAFKTGSSTIGTTWQIIVNLAKADGAPVDGGAARGGRHRLVRHLDGRCGVRAQELRVPVAGLDRLTRGQRPGRGVVRRGAGQRRRPAT